MVVFVNLIWCSIVSAQVPEDVQSKLREAPAGAAHEAELDLIFNFRSPPDQAYIDDIKDTIQGSSEMLCDATDGQLLISRVRLTEGATMEDEASVWLQPFGGRSFANISNDGDLPGGAPISLTRSGARSTRTLGHELGHYLFGLGDEYGEQDRFRGACGIGPSFDPGDLSEVDHSIMQQPWENRCATVDSATGYYEITGGTCGPCGSGRTCDPSLNRCRATDSFGNFVGEAFRACGSCTSAETCKARGGKRCVLPDASESGGYALMGMLCNTDSDCNVSGAECRQTLHTEFSVQANHDPLQGSGQVCPAPQKSTYIALWGSLNANELPKARDPEAVSFNPSNYAIAEWTSTYAPVRNRESAGLYPARGCESGPCPTVIDELGYVENKWGLSPSLHEITPYFERISGPVPANLSGSEVCDNGIDDDGDNLTDCADDDCNESLACDTSRWKMHLGVATRETTNWGGVCRIQATIAIRAAIDGSYSVTLNGQTVSVSATSSMSRADIAQQLADKIVQETPQSASENGPFVVITADTAGADQLSSSVSSSSAGTIAHRRGCKNELSILKTYELFYENGSLIAINGQNPANFSGLSFAIDNFATGASTQNVDLRMDGVYENPGTPDVNHSSDGDGVCTRSCAGYDGSGCVVNDGYCESAYNYSSQRYELSQQSKIRHGDSDWETITKNDYFENLLSVPSFKPEAVPPAHCSSAVDIVEDVEAAEQVMLVIDRSRSMDTDYKDANRLAYAKSGARVFLKAYRNAATPLKVGLVQFNEHAKQLWPTGSATLDALTPTSYPNIEAALNNMTPDGQTGMGRALEATRPAFESLNSGPRTVFMLSDGFHNTGRDPEPVAQELRRDLGVRIFSLPVSGEADDETMTTIAGQSDGAVYDAPNPTDLPPAYFALAARVKGYALTVGKTPISVSGPKVKNSPFPQAEVVKIPVEAGSKSLRLLLSSNMNPHDWGVKFQLISPSGNIVLNDSDSRVQHDGMFDLARIWKPEPGTWSVKIIAGMPKDQHSFFAAYVEHDRPDCFVNVRPSKVTPGDDVQISVSSYWKSPLVEDKYAVDIVAPDGTITSLNATRDFANETPSVEYSGFSDRGQYQVFASCNIEDETPVMDGEPIFAGPVRNERSEAFFRRAQGSFFAATSKYYCPGPPSDCDDDGIPTKYERYYGKDTDRDGVPDYADPDADGDEVPDREEGTGDCDKDKSQNYLDTDSDGDGVSDSHDNCPCKKGGRKTGCP